MTQFCSFWCVCIFSHSVVSDSLQCHGLYPPGSSVHGISQATILEWVAICYSRGVFLIEPRSPALTGRCEPPFHCVLVPYLLYLFLRPWTFEDLMVFIYSELDFAVHALGSPAAAAFPRAYLRDSPPLQGQGCSLP